MYWGEQHSLNYFSEFDKGHCFDFSANNVILLQMGWEKWGLGS